MEDRFRAFQLFIVHMTGIIEALSPKYILAANEDQFLVWW